MKKFLFLLVSSLVLLLAACGGESEEGNNEESRGTDASAEASSANESEEENTEASNEVFENEDYKFVFGEAEQLEGIRGNQVLAIEIEFTNKSDEAQSPWSASTVVLDQSEVSDVTTESVMGANGELPEDYKEDLYRMDTEINSGETVDAILAFEIQNPGSEIQIADSVLSEEDITFERVYETE
ncbi:DUF5067 domain-containing protein [Oceanobacillus timonensis]|uniref:DUF5067 domain-containing protein n=1 Tax=Oceanobacillus timonensis TaxID=1926285 RepID=UPI0015C4D1AD|nr:DUF5067 domain-containing protein [Oceanobacillus timonensis]